MKKITLIEEYPILIYPSLAEEIGLNEAIVFQQLHYWLKKSNNVKQGHKWVYNTYKDWQKQFPFWSERTIRRTINNLEQMGLVISGNFNELKIDKTKWYRINYRLVSSNHEDNLDTLDKDKMTVSDKDKMTSPLPETTTKTTNQILNNKYEQQFNEFWLSYPKKVDKKKAQKFFKVAIKKHSFEQILEGAQQYAAHVKQARIEKQYIKHASTFLNNESYLNEYEVRNEADRGYNSQYDDLPF